MKLLQVKTQYEMRNMYFDYIEVTEYKSFPTIAFITLWNEGCDGNPDHQKGHSIEIPKEELNDTLLQIESDPRHWITKCIQKENEIYQGFINSNNDTINYYYNPKF